ncbi:hypothetical protein CFC21_108664, partial [Triticum aestivum]
AAGEAALQLPGPPPPPRRRVPKLAPGPRPRRPRRRRPQAAGAVAAAADVVRGPQRHPLRGRRHGRAALRQRLELLLAALVAVARARVGDAAPGPPHGPRRLPHLGLHRRRPRRASDLPPAASTKPFFQVLDYIIYEARRNHIRLILCLVNNLDNFGGKAQYVKWAQAAGANLTNSTDSFFYHPTIKGYYKDFVKAILTRRNSYSGIRYSDEPAIFAWELMNEPRCVSNSSGPHLQAWIAEMAAYVKSLDTKHLVTVGIEGFYGTGIAERLGYNPGDWAASFCSDFIQNSAVENIDFASVHAYPDSWLPKASMEEKLRYLSSWVDSHLNDSEHILKKPVLFSEVGYLQHVDGNSTVDRDILLRVVYDKIYDSARKLQAGGGALIWQLMVEGTHMYHDDFSLVARDHPSTYKLITEQSCRLQMLYKNDKRP